MRIPRLPALLCLLLAGAGHAQPVPLSVPPSRPDIFEQLLGEARGPVVSGPAAPGSMLGIQYGGGPGPGLPPAPAKPDEGGYYIVQKGDSLSAIALRFYGSFHLWPFIFQANRSLIADPDLIYPGQRLLIPGLRPGLASPYIPRGVGPEPAGGSDPQLVALARQGTVTTRTPGFEGWFNEAVQVARSSWRFPQLVNRYGRPVTHDAFLKTILYIESRGIHGNAGRTTTSGAGAIGFMQLMPDTARGLGVNPHDPRQNLIGGSKYLAQCFDSRAAQVPGDNALDRLVKAACAYNKGPYDKTLSSVTWDRYVSIGVPETVRYGIMVKMALGFDLTPNEQSWIARDRGISVQSVDSMADSTYRRTSALV